MSDIFKDIKKGDKVGFRLGFKRDIFRIDEVTHTTPKCFDVGSRRFSRADGYEKGGGRFASYTALKVTPEFLAEKAKAEVEEYRKNLAHTLEGKLIKLPLAALESIAGIVNSQPAEPREK